MRRVTGSLLVLSFVIILGLLALASPSMILRAEDFEHAGAGKLRKYRYWQPISHR